MDVTLKELPSWPPFSEDRPVTPSPGPARPSAGPLGAGTCMAAHATVSPASSLYRRFYSFFWGGVVSPFRFCQSWHTLIWFYPTTLNPGPLPWTPNLESFYTIIYNIQHEGPILKQHQTRKRIRAQTRGSYSTTQRK